MTSESLDEPVLGQRALDVSIPMTADRTATTKNHDAGFAR